MSINEARAYVNAHYGYNGLALIDGDTDKTALLAILDLIEMDGSWSPVLALTVNGPNIVIKVVDWVNGTGVKPAVNTYLGSTGFVTDINLAVSVRGPQGLPGLAGTGTVSSITSPVDGGTSPRFFPVCELPAITGGTNDFAEIELRAKSWASAEGNDILINLYIANRSAGDPYYQYTTQGSASYCSLLAYRVADGRLIVYAMTDNNFRAIAVRVNSSLQATIYGSLIPQATVTGTKYFDSGDPATYPPMMNLRSRFTSFYASNSDGGLFPPVITSPGNGLISIGSNYIAGNSDVALINANLSGSGFSFWQMLSAGSKRFLATLTGAGRLGIGVTAPAEMLDIAGRLKTKGVVSTGSLPTASVSTAGAGGTASVTVAAGSNDIAGKLTLTTSAGSSAGNNLLTLTFNVAYSATPVAVQISARNAKAAEQLTRVYVSAITPNGFSLSSSGTALSVDSFDFQYLVIA
ncbi:MULTISPECIES: hypothetical protein [unclassified Spirosoma]|uniref:hypothetical protein n=1 Tax=unclassified Spirosoma TaxID=2621999 RepID=UPI000962009D|nr:MULTISPECIES: hypothetical protein [unclassified Spirosoma]MBN8824450.1 hypothetical protein [Spirosoma sp.]OJW70087.1 MAG: hypothetical protein BGO59_25775 [Spirosoma sp. 48-14]